MRTGVRVPLNLVRGEGARVWDEDGKEYLDFVAGIATVSLGHSSPVVVEALTRQAQTLIHVSNIFYSVPQIDLAELLVEQSGMSQAFFCNSGAEANEGCIKLARKWAGQHRDGAYEIIVADGGFHGRTLTNDHGQRHTQVRRALRAAAGGLRARPLRRHRGAAGGRHAVNRRDHAGTAAGRGRRQRPGRRLPARRAPPLRRRKRGAHPGRGTDRHGALRADVRLPASGHHARHHVAGQGPGRRRPGRRVPDQRPLRRLRTGRPRHDLWRAAAGHRRRAGRRALHGRRGPARPGRGQGPTLHAATAIPGGPPRVGERRPRPGAAGRAGAVRRHRRRRRRGLPGARAAGEQRAAQRDPLRAAADRQRRGARIRRWRSSSKR